MEMIHLLLNLNALMKSACPALIKYVIGAHNSSRESILIINVLFKIVELTKNFAWMTLTNKWIMLEKNYKAPIRMHNCLNAANILKSKLSSCVDNARSSYALFVCLFTLITTSRLMFKQSRKFLKTVNSL